jgi:hypothetical protein
MKDLGKKMWGYAQKGGLSVGSYLEMKPKFNLLNVSSIKKMDRSGSACFYRGELLPPVMPDLECSEVP